MYETDDPLVLLGRDAGGCSPACSEGHTYFWPCEQSMIYLSDKRRRLQWHRRLARAMGGEWWEPLLIVAVAVGAGWAVGRWWTENDWVQVAAMCVVTLLTAMALPSPGRGSTPDRQEGGGSS